MGIHVKLLWRQPGDVFHMVMEPKGGQLARRVCGKVWCVESSFPVSPSESFFPEYRVDFEKGTCQKYYARIRRRRTERFWPTESLAMSTSTSAASSVMDYRLSHRPLRHRRSSLVQKSCTQRLCRFLASRRFRNEAGAHRNG